MSSRAQMRWAGSNIAAILHNYEKRYKALILARSLSMEEPKAQPQNITTNNNALKNLRIKKLPP